jgi:hypothetical protein
MRYIRLVVISLLIMTIALLGVSFLLPSQIMVARVINIAAKKDSLFHQINDLKNWDRWNQFATNKALTNKVFSDPSFGEGAFMKTDQLVVRITESNPDHIRTSWTQPKAKDFEGGFNFYTQSADTVSVQWYLKFQFKWYSLSKFTSFFYENQFGPVIESSLLDLKRLAENNH